MAPSQQADPRRTNTVALLGQAYSLLGLRIVDGAAGAGHPHKANHSAVLAQIEPGGSRLTKLAAGANMTPQSMGVIVDELEELGYVVRRPDPADRRAKLVTLTARGRRAVAAGEETVSGLEEELVQVLGERGARQLRGLLLKILASAD